MNGTDSRLQQLQQIPLFALRDLLHRLLDNPATRANIRDRFQTVLRRRPRDPQRAVHRLTREQITALIAACPEGISDSEIQALFEEYRYGSNPSFFIFLFDADRLDRQALASLRSRFEAALEPFNQTRPGDLPRVRSLSLNDLGPLPGRPEVTEGKYRFLARLDYVDEDENAVSTYETLYGFFWLNTAEGYAIIQARQPDVLKALRSAVEQGANIPLIALVITKRFKKALKFLQTKELRSARLHDPNPGPQTFRWLTIADEDPYGKGYQDWEDRYPEVRSARYRTLVANEKETLLTVRCEQGALSLAGAVPASLFRSWCLDSLGQLLAVHCSFQANASAYVPTLDLANKPELAGLNSVEKKQVLGIIVALLSLKQAAVSDLQPLDTPPLALAVDLARFVTAQIPWECPEPGCGEQGAFRCGGCGETQFSVKRQNDTWEMACAARGHPRWTARLPLEIICPQGHRFILDAESLNEAIELLPGPDLLQTIAGVINGYLKKDFSFDPSQETFIVRGRNLLYYPDRAKLPPNISLKAEINIAKVGDNATVDIFGISVGKLGK